jgi:hypothetical protein
VAVTDASGYAAFYDYGSVLDGAVATTAGEEGRAYFTVAGARASDLVLALPLLHPPAVPTTVYGGTANSGGVNPWLPTGCDDLDFGIVLPKLSLDTFSAFRPASLFSKSRCWVANNIVGTMVLPENMWLPAQALGPLCFGGTTAEGPWSLALGHTDVTGIPENVQMVMGSVPAAAGDLDLGDLVTSSTYRRLGFMLDETVPSGSTTSRSLPMNETYGNTYTVALGGMPLQTDVVGVTAADYSGSNGSGPLMMLATAVRAWDSAATNVVIRNSDLNAAGAPVGERRLASVTALYLDPDDRSSPPPANRRSASTTVLLRDDGAGGAPFGTAGGAGSANDFLALASPAFVAPARFTWDDASANGNAPLYSRHELTVRTRAHLPVLSCAATNEQRDSFRSQWIVVRPFAPACLGQECFDLPTLPASFPRAVAGPQQRSGFEARLGSGVACEPGDCLSGETCADPDGAGPQSQMCMRGAGTDADPYAVEDYVWNLHVYDLALAPAFDFNAFAFDRRRDWLTHESFNTHVIN